MTGIKDNQARCQPAHRDGTIDSVKQGLREYIDIEMVTVQERFDLRIVHYRPDDQYIATQQAVSLNRSIRFAVNTPASLQVEVDGETVERALIDSLSNAMKCHQHYAGKAARSPFRCPLHRRRGGTDVEYDTFSSCGISAHAWRD